MSRESFAAAEPVAARHPSEPTADAAGAPRDLIDRTAARAAHLDDEAAAAAQRALDGKTKPRGSLGRLEALACRLAGIRGTAALERLEPAIVVCAADHGIAAEGVSAYPQEVTGQMLLNFAGGGAAVSVLARQAGARLVVADIGVLAPVGGGPAVPDRGVAAGRPNAGEPAILDRRVRAGTANAAEGPAMTVAEAERAVAHGIELAEELVADGVGIVALGEMGIGNTTAASALTAALLRADPESLVGPGTGLDAAGVEHKRGMVRRALETNVVGPRDPIGAVAGVGGLEIAALAGVVLGCSANRTPVLVDGFIAAAAALAAVCVQQRCADALIAAHLSPEPGHRLIVGALGQEPLLDLGMRLGEGSGAALALPLVAAAVAILTEMASFDEAGVTDAGA